MQQVAQFILITHAMPIKFQDQPRIPKRLLIHINTADFLQQLATALSGILFTDFLLLFSSSSPPLVNCVLKFGLEQITLQLLETLS